MSAPRETSDSDSSKSIAAEDLRKNDNLDEDEDEEETGPRRSKRRKRYMEENGEVPAKRSKRKTPRRDRERRCHELKQGRKAEDKALATKPGGKGRGGSWKKADIRETQIRVSLQVPLNIISWLKIGPQGGPQLNFFNLYSQAKENYGYKFVQFWKHLTYNTTSTKSHGTSQTHFFDPITGMLKGNNAAGICYSLDMIKWLISDFNDPTYQPQSVEQLLLRLDGAICTGVGAGKLLATKCILLGMSFLWAIIFNRPPKDINPIALIKLALIPAKLAYQATRGTIDYRSWQSTMEFFDLVSNLDDTVIFSSGAAMPQNVELEEFIANNQVEFDNRIASDEELRSIGYGIKLSYKQVQLKPDLLNNYVNNYAAILKHGRDRDYADKENRDAALAAGIWPATVDMLYYRNEIQAERRPSFFTDVLETGGLKMNFDRTLLDFHLRPSNVLAPGDETTGENELLNFWTPACDTLNLEALDAWEPPKLTEMEILQYLGCAFYGSANSAVEDDEFAQPFLDESAQPVLVEPAKPDDEEDEEENDDEEEDDDEGEDDDEEDDEEDDEDEEEAPAQPLLEESLEKDLVDNNFNDIINDVMPMHANQQLINVSHSLGKSTVNDDPTPSFSYNYPSPPNRSPALFSSSDDDDSEPSPPPRKRKTPALTSSSEDSTLSSPNQRSDADAQLAYAAHDFEDLDPPPPESEQVTQQSIIDHDHDLGNFSDDDEAEFECPPEEDEPMPPPPVHRRIPRRVVLTALPPPIPPRVASLVPSPSQQRIIRRQQALQGYENAKEICDEEGVLFEDAMRSFGIEDLGAQDPPLQAGHIETTKVMKKVAYKCVHVYENGLTCDSMSKVCFEHSILLAKKDMDAPRSQSVRHQYTIRNYVPFEDSDLSVPNPFDRTFRDQ
uniref:Uncharacterized protein n=1 Tax=Panagrolaimus sp. ES5 TaxID=591445 RepID=A0AC34FTY2_9BILA